ncbi:MAG: 50S ribosomal protein L23 [Candidatus Doudnabacteria bacterium]|nr:50S ribosomal protein L23 [Candidatus Doudnabacteria bacterium]
MATTTKKVKGAGVARIAPGERAVIRQPRLSEKAVSLNAQNKYVFTVDVKATKLQVRRHLEVLYGIAVASINMIRMEGKTRRYGRTVGKTRAFKKAIVTLTKDSKKPEVLEAA